MNTRQWPEEERCLKKETAFSEMKKGAGKLEPFRFGSPISLGGVVNVSLTQAVVYGTNGRGENEQYIAVTGSPAVFYAVNTESGAVKYSEPLKGTNVIWAMTLAPDGRVYIGGDTNGMLYRYSPDEAKLEMLGINPSGMFVWDLKAGIDGKLYGATYPYAKVFEYDANTSSFRDLGAMKDGMQYARSVAVTDRFLYVGIGANAHLVRYDRKSGEKAEIVLPFSGESGIIYEVNVYQGKLFLKLGSELHVLDERTGNHLHTIEYQGKISPPAPHRPHWIYFKRDGDLCVYDMESNETAVVTTIPRLAPEYEIKQFAWVTLRSGQKSGKTVLAGISAFITSFFYDPDDGTFDWVKPAVDPQPVLINALNAADGIVGVGGFQRGFSVLDQRTGQVIYTNETLHQPENVIFADGAVYIGTYPGARMYRFDLAHAIDDRKAHTAYGNPGVVLDIGEDQDRPFAIASGDGKLFIGTFPGYGKLGGALTVMEEKRDAEGNIVSVEFCTYRHIVSNQSVFGLAYRNGKLYGGTSVAGGLGIAPTEREAKMFVFDVNEKRKIAEFTPQISGLDSPILLIGDLTFGPDGLLWGAIDGTIFAMDPDTFKIVKSRIIYPTVFATSRFRPFYLRWGRDGRLYTTLGRKLTVVCPETLHAEQLAEETVNVMALGDDGSIYYAVGTGLFRLPTEAER
jgi:outer membrane protein assembly factor BamB